MGRTNPTFRDYLRGFERRWQPFRRALRRRHREDFDRLFDGARAHADAAGQQNATDPDRAVLLAMLLAQERRIRRLRGRVDELDPDTQADDADPDVPADGDAGSDSGSSTGAGE